MISDTLLPAAAALSSGLDAALGDAAAIMACCRARHPSLLGRAVRAGAAAVGGFAAFFGVAACIAVVAGRRRRLAGALQLPTYGLSQYSRPASRQHSWQL